MGSIPACTGEPDSNAHSSNRVKVYPRVYGGTQADGDIDIDGWGLSPRVRGNPSLKQSILGLEGSIPACTGEPAPSNPGANGAAVYPRVYGGTGYAQT